MAPAAEGDGSLPQSSCLSLFGLAFDASEREVHVLFSGCAGFVRCVLQPGKSATQRPYAFVQFGDQESALAALESREGTTWEEGGSKINIEFSKRDIPDKFKSQGQRAYDHGSYYEPSAAQYAPAHYAPAAHPPAKRSRRDDYPPDDGPKTLHLGGLPKGLHQADLDAFLATNFPQSCLGGTLSGSGGSSSWGRAFVGFSSNRGANEALKILDGYNWDGAILRPEFARSEWKPLGGAGGSYEQPPPPASAPRDAWHGGGGGGGYDSWQDSRSGSSKGSKGKGKGGGKDKGGPATRTLHFTNLPPICLDEFEGFMQSTFTGMVEVCNFKDSGDGRPPVAWVLFVDENAAAEIAGSHATFDWNDTHVRVAYARTDLDPAKFKKHD